MGKKIPYHFRVKFGIKWMRMTANQIKTAERKLHRKLEVTA